MIRRSRVGAQAQSRTTAGLWALALCLAPIPGIAGQPYSADGGDTGRVLAGAILVDGNGGPAVADSVVVISGGRIECAGTRDACPVPDDAEVHDLQDRWLIPGLVDAHMHFSQTGFYDGRPDAEDLRERFPYEQVQARQKAEPERYLDAYLCSGVTAVFDVGGFPWSIDLAARSQVEPRWPEIAASGPLVTHWVPEILNLAGSKLLVPLEHAEGGRRTVRELAAFGADAVKIWFLPVADPARQGSIDARILAAGEEAGRLDIPLIVHATSLREAKVALQAGARVLVHSVDDQAVDEEFIRLAREAGVIYIPTLIVARGYLNTRKAFVGAEAFAIDDPRGCVDADTRALLENAAAFRAGAAADLALAPMERRIGAREETMAANLRRVHEAGITIAAGSDAGNPGTLHGVALQSELEAMQAAGLKAREILVMATRNGARAMGRESELGTLEAGKLANLIVLEADPAADIGNLRAVRRVMLRGEWVVEW